jgi:hypothetical protein
VKFGAAKLGEIIADSVEIRAFFAIFLAFFGRNRGEIFRPRSEGMIV